MTWVSRARSIRKTIRLAHSPLAQSVIRLPRFVFECVFSLSLIFFKVLLGQRQSFALDVWGFGCLMYFVLSRGFHPYGARIHRESNILANKVNLYRVSDAVALHLISKCLQVMKFHSSLLFRLILFLPR